MNATRALGRYGEELAVRTLTATGLHVLARNWRCGRTGEIDIVARDGDTLVICEVKTRREGAFEHPMAAVTPRKAERLRRLAACWLDRHGGPAGGPPGRPLGAPAGGPSGGSSGGTSAGPGGGPSADQPGGPSAGPPGLPPGFGGVRIDLVGIVLPRRGAPVVTHAQGVA
ncbi:YraN family protein [Streptomyces sp. NPDC101160]|uniref:YraN family protein n=1 Tax=Streptomyces sp. NPDC101160 TaxID=3366118 RepID=UPI0037FF74DA